MVDIVGTMVSKVAKCFDDKLNLGLSGAVNLARDEITKAIGAVAGLAAGAIGLVVPKLDFLDALPWEPWFSDQYFGKAFLIR